MNVIVDQAMSGLIDILFDLLPWLLAAVLILAILAESLR